MHLDFSTSPLAHCSHARPGSKPVEETLYVVSVVSNTCRYQVRYDHARAFEKYVEDSGAQLLLVEMSFGDRPFELTSRSNPWHLQLTTNSNQEMWQKEAAINAGFARLKQLVPTWKYGAWIDADIFFSRTDWVQETIHQLQHFDVIQPWSQVYYLDPEDGIIEKAKSFGYCYLNNVPEANSDSESYYYYGGYTTRSRAKGGSFWHPGFAWAVRRSFLDTVGGLFDQGILGAGDHIMAKALLGRTNETIPPEASKGFHRAALLWQDRAKRIGRNLGCAPGSIFHRFHGSLKNRNYRARWAYLTAGKEAPAHTVAPNDHHKFDPATDLVRDHQGLLALREEKITLRQGCREYFRNRKEDRA